MSTRRGSRTKRCSSKASLARLTGPTVTKFTWTQEEIDKTIAMYEGVLADIKKGVMYSKTVDGQDQLVMSYDPADISTSADTEVTRP